MEHVLEAGPIPDGRRSRGVNWSGLGRFGGWAALEAFTELRWIPVGGSEGRRYPI